MAQPLSDAALDQLFRAARSYTDYLDKPVTTEQLRAIWELMKYGPTSANILPARLVWCVSADARERLAQLASSGNDGRIRKAPVAVIVGMDINFHEHMPALYPQNPKLADFFAASPARESTALLNSSLQVAYFVMAVRALGLDTRVMAGFDKAGVDAAFFAATPQVKSSLIATLGYGDPATLPERSPRPGFDAFNAIA